MFYIPQFVHCYLHAFDSSIIHTQNELNVYEVREDLRSALEKKRGRGEKYGGEEGREGGWGGGSKGYFYLFLLNYVESSFQ